MLLEEARELALGLPETTEEPHFEYGSWRTRGKILVTIPPDGETLHVFVDEDEVRACVDDDPETYSELRWGKRLNGVRVHLPTAEPDQVRELIEEAWRRRAYKRTVAAYDARRDD